MDTDKLYAARLTATRVRPYLATALFALHLVPSSRVPTMAVDRHWRCYVSPAFVDGTPVDELAGVLVHEVSHLLRDHHGRSDRVARRRDLTGRGDRLRMNIAADFEINDDVYGNGLAKPDGAVEPAMLGLDPGQLMEDYLPQFRLGWATDDMAWLDCGSGADGLERDWDLGADGAHGLSDEERDAVRFRVAQGLTGQPGDVPQGCPPLRRRPPRVTVIVDTSGSVSDTELGSALLEVTAIARAVGGRRDLVSVMSCDAAAGVAYPLCRAEGVPLVGGGTDLRAGFARALRSAPRPDVVVALTDGQTPWPQSRPSCRAVVGLFSRPVREDRVDTYDEPPPPWARVVRIG